MLKKIKIEKRLRDFLHLKSTKHFVHCKKALQKISELHTQNFTHIMIWHDVFTA